MSDPWLSKRSAYVPSREEAAEWKVLQWRTGQVLGLRLVLYLVLPHPRSSRPPPSTSESDSVMQVSADTSTSTSPASPRYHCNSSLNNRRGRWCTSALLTLPPIWTIKLQNSETGARGLRLLSPGGGGGARGRGRATPRHSAASPARGARRDPNFKLVKQYFWSFALVQMFAVQISALAFFWHLH